MLIVCSVAGLDLHAQPGAAPAVDPGDAHLPIPTNLTAGTAPEEKLAALSLEMTNACQRVLQIVNRPATAYVRIPNIEVATYKEGWFHPGAAKPDFNTVDVRQSQELTYAKFKYVTSDLNPGVMFLGQDLEFNSMTKLFYTNRSLPKRKLAEAEMLEINRLYRIIGRCEEEIARLQSPPTSNQARRIAVEGSDEPVIPGQRFERLRSIPKSTRLIWGGLAIGALLLLVMALRVFRKKAGSADRVR